MSSPPFLPIPPDSGDRHLSCGKRANSCCTSTKRAARIRTRPWCKSEPEARLQFFGIDTVQLRIVGLFAGANHYYQAFPKNRKSTKATVYTVFVLEVAQTGITSYFAYTVVGARYGNLRVFQEHGGVVPGAYFVCAAALYSDSWIPGGIVATLAVLRIGSEIGQGVLGEQFVDKSKLKGQPIYLAQLSPQCGSLSRAFPNDNYFEAPSWRLGKL
ncbi:hypothetical protein K438DRAFT_1988917 [Mycena galopus ATCC 62051]|nr:hypothetical protein K438DRAFT_1988917 [Mycena galopus ATCC 62051]